MPRLVRGSDDEEPLEDKTAPLQLHSKRTLRMAKRQEKQQQKLEAMPTLLKLPTELILESLRYLTPSDAFNFRCVNRRSRALVDANAKVLGNCYLKARYPLLARCFPLPRLLNDVDEKVREKLVDPKRQEALAIHRKSYQHVAAPDCHLLCTCLMCIMAWNNLNLVLDFAHWQHNLDHGIPIPTMPWGRDPEWNRELLYRNASIAEAAACGDSLWYAKMLELHLKSTIKSIKRHRRNRGNMQHHMRVTDEDVATGTDAFLAQYGPPSLEFPHYRDQYYLLEAYLPFRYWRKKEQKWMYTAGEQHDVDIRFLSRSSDSHVIWSWERKMKIR